MQRATYLVTDEAGRVLTWRHNIHQALRTAERFRDDRGSHVLVTQNGGVLAVACAVGSVGGADKILQEIDAAFRPYERYSERRLAEALESRKPVSYNVCACGAKDWEHLVNEGTAICRACGAYALVRKDHYGCIRTIPKKCSACRQTATERRRRWKLSSNQSHLYFCAGCAPPEMEPPRRRPASNHCYCGDSCWRSVGESPSLRTCATCGCYGRRYNCKGSTYTYAIVCVDCGNPATRMARRRGADGNRQRFFCETCVTKEEAA